MFNAILVILYAFSKIERNCMRHIVCNVSHIPTVNFVTFVLKFSDKLRN